MGNQDRGPVVEPETTWVSDALVEKLADEQTLWGTLRKGELWFLIDAPRWGIVAGLALGVFVTTLLVGEFGPYTVQQFLLGGTSMASSYVGIVQGLFTAIVIVMSVNQLILQGKFGPLSNQTQRLDAVLSHRRDVEESADVVSSPEGVIESVL